MDIKCGTLSFNPALVHVIPHPPVDHDLRDNNGVALNDNNSDILTDNG